MSRMCTTLVRLRLQAIEAPADFILPYLSPAYKQEHEPEAETKANRDMIERAVGALNVLSPKLNFVVFPSGTRVSL